MTRPKTDLALAPIADPNGNTLWIHFRCGDTVWADGDGTPEWCPTCSFRTDAWRQVFADATFKVRREQPRSAPGEM